jgi:hypothetical protein
MRGNLHDAPAMTVPAAGSSTPALQCGWEAGDCIECGCVKQCTRESRFRVERADEDPTYLPGEACAEHLGDTIAVLLEGQDIAAVVTVHWDEVPVPGAVPQPGSAQDGIREEGR